MKVEDNCGRGSRTQTTTRKRGMTNKKETNTPNTPATPTDMNNEDRDKDKYNIK